MTENPSPQTTPDAANWTHIVVPAPAEVQCCVCGKPVTGIDYRWRPVPDVIHDLKVAYAHPACIEDAP